jgi:hypothetical protein
MQMRLVQDIRTPIEAFFQTNNNELRVWEIFTEDCAQIFRMAQVHSRVNLIQNIERCALVLEHSNLKAERHETPLPATQLSEALPPHPIEPFLLCMSIWTSLAFAPSKNFPKIFPKSSLTDS